jgi:hypothetical protein
VIDVDFLAIFTLVFCGREDACRFVVINHLHLFGARTWKADTEDFDRWTKKTIPFHYIAGNFESEKLDFFFKSKI